MSSGWGEAVAKGFEWLIFENDPDKKLRRVRMKEYNKLKVISVVAFQVRLLQKKLDSETNANQKLILKKKLISKCRVLDRSLGF